MGLDGPRPAPKKKGTALNGHLKTILASVGGVLLASAIIATVAHFQNHGIHQDKVDKKNQTQVWFAEWWNATYQRDVKPEFDELKEMIREHDQQD
jgi:hypothetical protein